MGVARPASSRDDVVRLLLVCLRGERWLESLYTLERETGVTACGYGPRATLFRSLVLGGHWAEVLPVVDRLLEKSPSGAPARRDALRSLRRQQLFELATPRADGRPPDIQAFTSCLEELRKVCTTEEEYKAVAGAIADPHWEPGDWSLWEGRFSSFELLLPHLRAAYGKIEVPDEPLAQPDPSGRLLDVLQRGLAATSAAGGEDAGHATPLCAWSSVPGEGPAVQSVSTNWDSVPPLTGDGLCADARIGAGDDGVRRLGSGGSQAPEPATDAASRAKAGLWRPRPQAGSCTDASARDAVEPGYEQLLPELLRPVAQGSEPHAIRCAAFSGAGTSVALGTNSRALVQCRIPSASEIDSSIRQASKDGGPKAVAPSNSTTLPLLQLRRLEKLHNGSVYCVAWDTLRSVAATGSNDQSVRLVRLPDDMCGGADGAADRDARLSLNAGAVRGVAFLDDTAGAPRLAAASDGEATVRLWDAETCAELPKLQGLREPPTAFAAPLHDDAKGLVCAGSGGAILLWDIRAVTRTPTQRLAVPSSCRAISAAAVGGHAVLVAVGSQDGQTLVWDLRRDAEPMAQWAPHTDSVRSVALDPTRRYLAAASMDGSVSVCDTWLPSSRPESLRGHTNHVVCVAWHPERPLLLSTSADGCAKLWGPVGA